MYVEKANISAARDIIKRIAHAFFAEKQSDNNPRPITYGKDNDKLYIFL